MDLFTILLVGVQACLIIWFVCILLKNYISEQVKKTLQQWIDESDGDI